jgi:hypothetical protein
MSNRLCQVVKSNNTICNQPAHCFIAEYLGDNSIPICIEHAKIMFPNTFGLIEEEVKNHPDIKKD